ncbi:ABC transporter ATP-binding protein [Paenibacillus thermoaerophilus]|uniref:ABC transporter ATP-binding protein n=1 Tax=Paenibacillus thermoaerophilus TaxID=1215385 RepID=A0ABW2V4X9_9BACL|nr:ABC transporter ATP-binding protein [Paenibacillus thermoaerophilus]TMV14338.1 ABC transporter ATP-binding protein [Paenibacillus thermoaerophilus]
MTTERRLWQYAMLYKKPIVWALVLLALSVCAEMAGPFLAKRMIDQNILGIEKPWYEVREGAEEDKYAVAYGDAFYKREDRWAEGETRGREVRVLQVGRDYYFVGEPVASTDGERSIRDGGFLTIAKDGQSASYPAAKLSRGELLAFFKPEIGGMMTLAAAYFGLLAVGAAFAYGQRYLLQVSANRIIRRMRDDVFAHIQRLPVHYFDNMPAGKVVSRVTNDTEAVRELYVAVLANFFAGVVYIAAILGALFLLDKRLALIALPMVPILYVWIVVYRKIAGRYNKVIRSRLSDINAMINESIQGMPIIQAFRREKTTEAEFGELNEDFFKYQNKLLNLNSITSHNLVNLIRNVLFLTVVWLFAGGWLGAYVTVGVLFAFIDYMNRMMNPIVGIVNQLSNLETARVSAGRVFELLDQPGAEVADSSRPRFRGDVSFENVWFAYKEGEDVLRGITFHAKQGQTVALVGHTGSGKSSILNLLFRFYDTDRGVISIDGEDVRTIPRQQLRKHMGIVLQDPFLFTGTIASNVSLGDPSITREKVEQALKDVGAYDMFMNLPGGLDEPVVEKGATLSAGQRQLISFARALAFDPAILILDEATSSIDTETEAVIQSALDVLKRGRTTFVIAHRLSTIRAADQILVLDRGRIVERGNHDELMAYGGKYYAMYQLQQGGAEFSRASARQEARLAEAEAGAGTD